MLRIAIIGCGKIADQHMQAIRRIDETILQINEIGSSIEASIAQQDGATSEIARSTHMAALSAADVGESIKRVDAAAADTDGAASNVVGAAAKLGKDVAALRSHIGEFLARIRAA